MRRLKTAALISGGGSNMAALVAAAKQPDYPAEIALVISSRPDAGGLAKAEAAGIPTAAFDHKAHDRPGLERLVDEELAEAGIELVCLAGWMRLLSPYFIERWHNRLINIHPALLPSFKGLHTHQRVLDEGVKIHGCTVHYVRQEMDAGPIIAQAAVPVLDGDTADILATRVLMAEHMLYPHALALVASGRARVEGEHVVYSGQPSDAVHPLLIAPPL
ncbi:phosphoribosylglycinamide formyltransferase [Flaviflagellibacter deserti]|uniref:Phosphoribosylglycinamide formyltransferase n=1 Tax=Flaviflagellibacter deserti TaxID=2267266 RepID=A0ABV9Z3U2_9HYPH